MKGLSESWRTTEWPRREQGRVKEVGQPDARTRGDERRSRPCDRPRGSSRTPSAPSPPRSSAAGGPRRRCPLPAPIRKQRTRRDLRGDVDERRRRPVAAEDGHGRRLHEVRRQARANPRDHAGATRAPIARRRRRQRRHAEQGSPPPPRASPRRRRRSRGRRSGRRERPPAGARKATPASTSFVPLQPNMFGSPSLSA